MTNTQLHLQRFYPFLRGQFRTIEKKEIKSKTVFKELFGENEPFNENKLKVLYLFQNENKLPTIQETSGADKG